eukprot:74531_1
MSTLVDESQKITSSKSDIELEHILLVEGYIRNDKLLIVEDVKDLILLFYARRLLMKLTYNNKITCILYCPIKGSWNSMQKELPKTFNIIYSNNLQLSYKNQQITQNNWDSLRWNEDTCFQIDDGMIPLHQLIDLLVQTDIQPIQYDGELLINCLSARDITNQNVIQKKKEMIAILEDCRFPPNRAIFTMEQIKRNYN